MRGATKGVLGGRRDGGGRWHLLGRPRGGLLDVRLLNPLQVEAEALDERGVVLQFLGHIERRTLGPALRQSIHLNPVGILGEVLLDGGGDLEHPRHVVVDQGGLLPWARRHLEVRHGLATQPPRLP